MEWLSDPNIWISFLTLTVLEIVLRIDNIVFISIQSAKLPIEQQKKARQVGLLLALVMRVGLLFSIKWIMELTEPFLYIGDWFGIENITWHRYLTLSVRDLILFVGGVLYYIKLLLKYIIRLKGILL